RVGAGIIGLCRPKRPAIRVGCGHRGAIDRRAARVSNCAYDRTSNLLAPCDMGSGQYECKREENGEREQSWCAHLRTSGELVFCPQKVCAMLYSRAMIVVKQKMQNEQRIFHSPLPGNALY